MKRSRVPYQHIHRAWRGCAAASAVVAVPFLALRKALMRRIFKRRTVTGTGGLSKDKIDYPPWIELPLDLTENILWRLSAVEMLQSALGVCTTWRRVCRDPSKWRVIDFGTYCLGSTKWRIIDRIHRNALDCSQGQLIDVRFQNYCTDELLKYVSERSPNLKRLTLINCGRVGGNSLIAAVKNLPWLEELNLALSLSLLYRDQISIQHIDVVSSYFHTMSSVYGQDFRWKRVRPISC